MTLSLSFSGGINHKAEVPEEKHKEIAEKIAAAMKDVIEQNCGGGSGSVYVGTKNVTVIANSTGRAIDD